MFFKIFFNAALYIYGRDSNMILKRSSESGHLRLVPDFSVKAFSISLLNIILLWVCHKQLLC